MSPHVTSKIDEFFERLEVSPQPFLQGVAGTIRVDLNQDGSVGHWLIRIDHGRVSVSRRSGRADAVVTADQTLFEWLVTGEANSMTAALRGQLRLEGDTGLVVLFDRLLPSPPDRHTTLPPTGRGAKEAARRARGTGTAARTARASTAVASMTRRGRAR